MEAHTNKTKLILTNTNESLSSTINKKALPDCCVCKNDDRDDPVVINEPVYDDIARYEEFIKLLMRDHEWQYDKVISKFFDHINKEDANRPPGSSRFIEFAKKEFLAISRSRNNDVTKLVRQFRKSS